MTGYELPDILQDDQSPLPGLERVAELVHLPGLDKYVADRRADDLSARDHAVSVRIIDLMRQYVARTYRNETNDRYQETLFMAEDLFSNVPSGFSKEVELYDVEKDPVIEILRPVPLSTPHGQVGRRGETVAYSADITHDGLALTLYIDALKLGVGRREWGYGEQNRQWLPQDDVYCLRAGVRERGTDAKYARVLCQAVVSTGDIRDRHTLPWSDYTRITPKDLGFSTGDWQKMESEQPDFQEALIQTMQAGLPQRQPDYEAAAEIVRMRTFHSCVLEATSTRFYNDDLSLAREGLVKQMLRRLSNDRIEMTPQSPKDAFHQYTTTTATARLAAPRASAK